MSEPTTSVRPAGGPIPAAWREWFAFLRAPSLDRPRERFGPAAVGAVLWLLLLNVLVDLPLVTLLSWLSKRASITPPQLDELTKGGVLYTLLMGALLAPLLEEVLFRSWLDGRRRHITFWLMVLLVFGAFWKIGLGNPAQPVLAIGIALALIVVGAVLVWRAETSVPQWFARFFPFFYFGQALAFAGSHFGNYPAGSPLLLIPFVLPQLVAGLIFGFARVRYGMWANLALHASSNALFLTLMLAGL